MFFYKFAGCILGVRLRILRLIEGEGGGEGRGRICCEDTSVWFVRIVRKCHSRMDASTRQAGEIIEKATFVICGSDDARCGGREIRRLLQPGSRPTETGKKNLVSDNKGIAMKVEPSNAVDSSPKSALSQIPFHLSSSSSEDEKCASERSSENSSNSEYSDESNDHSASSSSDVDSELESEDDRWDRSPRRKKRKTLPNADGARPNSGTVVRKQRDDNPRRRQVGGRIYDSILGRTCHWCRQKTVEDHAECSRCPIRFCGACLSNRNGENVSDEMEKGVKWICPKCRGGCGPGCKNCCNCGPCRKTQNLAPTGQLIQVARRFGFSNVHDYLIHLKTKESPSVIAARKDGRGWTKITGGRVKEGRRWTKYTGSPVDRSASSDKEGDYSSGEDNVVKREFDDDVKISIKGTDKHERSADTRLFEESFVTEGLDDASQVLSDPADSKSDDKLGEKVEQRFDIVNEKERALCNNANRSAPFLPGAKTRKVKLAPNTKISKEDLISTVVSEVSENGRGSFGCIGGTDFARKLECTLQRPFSTLQLNQMQERMSFRKPIMRTRHTRTRAIEVPCSTEGLSYLDHYPDFAEELAEAGLPEEKLKLLRGFFFWLQHSSMEGSFRPWAKRENLDEKTGGDCVEISGPDCEVIGVLLAIDEDEINHPIECEDIKPQIKVFRSTSHPISEQSFSQPTVKVKIERE